MKSTPSVNSKELANRGGLISGLVNSLFVSLQSTAGGIKRAWDKFWFSPREPYTLGVMRWFVGGMLLYTHIIWGLDLDGLVGPRGWNGPDTLAVLQEGQFAPSFWWYVPEAWMMPVHIMCLVILFCFWIGLATRVTSVLAMVITVSYSYRALMANFGLDQINAILCFYLCIGPSGAVLSMDRLISVWREKRISRREQRAFLSPPVDRTASANLSVRLMQIHFCLIYAVAGLSKLQGPAWWSGESIWLAFANLEYQSFDMTWIARYPWISEVFTHGTILWEVTFAAAIWVRSLRPSMLFIGFLMHVGIGGLMGLWTFGLIMIFGHMCFYPKETMRRIANFWPSAEKLLGVTSAADLSMKVDTRSTAGLADRLKPALLYVDTAVRRRLDSLTYFLSRGFRCLATDDTDEAHRVCEATTPDVVVVLGTDMDDAQIESFHDQHCAEENHRPLFMVLTDDQSERLNGNIRTQNSHILSGKVSLGLLRREIEGALNSPGSRVDVSAPDAESFTQTEGESP